jgi:hypothetical protein
VLARTLADVLGGDPDPPIAIGLGDHRLEQSPVRLLDLTAATELLLSLAQPHGEAVANALELRHAQDAWAAHRRHAPLDPRAREGRREQLTQSLLEQRNLPTELVTHPAIGERIGDMLEISRAPP